MKLTDEQLVLAYKQGQKDAFDEIYLRYKNAVLCYAHSVYCIGADIEDVVQEGTLGLVKAVEYYNGKSSFKNFAFTCIKTNIIKAVKKMLSIKNLPLNNSLDINECEKELKKVGDNLEDKIIFKEKFDALLEKAKEDLPFYGDRAREIEENASSASDFWILYDRPKFKENEIFEKLSKDLSEIKELK